MARSFCIAYGGCMNSASSKPELSYFNSLVILKGHTRSAMPPLAFIATFFVSKQILSLTTYTCWPPDASAALAARGAALGLRVRALRGLRGAPPPPPALRGGREGVLLDTACGDADRILNEASAAYAFTHHYAWLLLHDESSNSSLGLLDALEMLPDSDVTWLAPAAVLDLYRVKKDQPLVLTPLQLTREDSLDKMRRMWSELPPPARRRQNLRNVSLSAAVVISEPQNFKGWSDLTNRQIDTFPKLTYPLMMLLAEDLNYRHNMRQELAYGARQADGTFSGLAGALQRRQVLIGASSIFMRADRWEIMDFVAETCELRGAFIFRQPSQSSVSNVFLLPFSRGVWAAAGGVLALTAALLTALARALRPRHPALQALTAAEAVTFAIGTICQQGSHVPAAATPVRLVMFSALVCSLFAFTAYGAKIVSILQAPSAALQTIEDLARSPLTLLVQNTTYRRVYFAESAEPATQRLYRHKLLPYGDAVYVSVVEGVARLRTGLYAFQVEQSAGYEVISQTFSEAEKCALQEIQAFRLPMVAIPLAKRAGYRDLFATRVRWQREAGLMSRARRRWLSARARCAGAAGGGFLSVALADVQPALQILCGGAGLAVLLLGAECALFALTTRAARADRARCTS